MGSISNAAVSIHYETMGEGAPLVLLHGFTSSLGVWSETGYVTPLLDAGRRLVLIDLRGHGRSARPHDIDAYGDEARAGDVVRVLDALAIERADIFGYSMGGWIALNIARYHRDRIDRLIVGGCHPFGQSMAFYRRAMAGSIDDWITVVESLAGGMSEAWKRRVRANDIIALRAAVARDRPDIAAELIAFDRPCLIYCGSEDPLYEQAVRCEALLPNSRFFAIEGCNHVTALLRADLVMPELLRFLSTPSPDAPARGEQTRSPATGGDFSRSDSCDSDGRR